jgi:hypothetical protein
MAKTRRKKQNRSPKGNPQIQYAVVETGMLLKVAGHRSDPKKLIPSKVAKPVNIGRVYTGINKGKVYPYAGAKRGGVPALRDDSRS